MLSIPLVNQRSHHHACEDRIASWVARQLSRYWIKRCRFLQAELASLVDRKHRLCN